MSYSINDNITSLVGRTVEELWLEQEEESLLLKLASSFQPDWFLIELEGDCCSETWFADILGVPNLLGNPIVSWEHKVLNPRHEEAENSRSRQEYDKFYGLTISTLKGCCDFAYRNSSYGYYGGDINRAELVPTPDLTKYRQLTSDYSA